MLQSVVLSQEHGSFLPDQVSPPITYLWWGLCSGKRYVVRLTPRVTVRGGRRRVAGGKWRVAGSGWRVAKATCGAYMGRSAQAAVEYFHGLVAARRLFRGWG